MTIKLIHIGFPKASSSYLQQTIFKLIRKKKLLNFYSINSIERNVAHYSHYDFSNINENEDYIVSCEHLAFNFYHLDESYEYTKTIIKKLRSHFGPDAQILLILREPSELIASIYNQYARVKIGYPKTGKKNFKLYMSFKDFIHKYRDNIIHFSYSKIISLVEKEFKNIFVIKHENLHQNMDNIFSHSSYNHAKYESSIKKVPLVNRSLSNQALLLTLFANRFLSFLRLDLNSIDKLIDRSIKIYNYLIHQQLNEKKRGLAFVQEKEYWNRFMYYLDRKYFNRNNNSNSFKSLMPKEFKRLREEYDSIKESKIRPLIQ